MKIFSLIVWAVLCMSVRANKARMSDEKRVERPAANIVHMRASMGQRKRDKRQAVDGVEDWYNNCPIGRPGPAGPPGRDGRDCNGAESPVSNASMCTGLETLRGNRLFKPLVNILISSGVTHETSVRSKQKVVGNPEECKDFCLCQYGLHCGVYSYNSLDRTCVISTLDFYASWTHTTRQTGATSYYLYKPGTWKVVYRRPKLIKGPQWANQVSGPWMDNSFYTDTIQTNAELTYDGDRAQIVKSNVVRFWRDLDISQVRIGVYRGSSEVKHILFSGVGTDDESWLAKQKLISSSWDNLNGQIAAGVYPNLSWWWSHPGGQVIMNRGVYMAQSHGGCNNDYVWLMAIQNQADTACDWERFPNAETPKILYSPTTASAANARNLEEADSLVFSILL